MLEYIGSDNRYSEQGLLQMVSVKMKLPLENEKKGTFLDTVRSVIEPIRIEEGCHQYGVYEDVENGDSVLLVQEWEDGDSLGRHLKGERFRRLLVAMDMLSGPPEVLVIDVQESKALRTIEELFDRLCSGTSGIGQEEGVKQNG